MKRTFLVGSLLLLFAWLPGNAQAPAGKLKVYISADMEGIGGVVTSLQLSPGQAEYERFREFMTGEVNAVIEAALEAGATEIVVSDSHGNAQNLLVEKLNPAARLVRSWPRPLLMMQGIDETFDAAIFIGYHAAEGIPESVLAHSMSGTRISWIKLNGTTVPEAGFNAAIAGHFGVPVILVAGDQGIIAQARQLLGDIEGAEVKHAYGVTSAMTLHPTAAQKLIHERTRAALARRKDFNPYRLPTPITLEVAFKRIVDAEILAMLPGVERPAGNVVRFRARDMVEAAKFLTVAMFFNAPS
jgi:D-amino peptidase